jgi:hypothetical protein
MDTAIYTKENITGSGDFKRGTGNEGAHRERIPARAGHIVILRSSLFCGAGE